MIYSARGLISLVVLLTLIFHVALHVLLTHEDCSKHNRTLLRGESEKKQNIVATTAISNDERVKDGEEWLETIESDLIISVMPTVQAMLDKFSSDGSQKRDSFLINGSWPAKLIADKWKQAGKMAPNLVANDIDLFYEYEESEKPNYEGFKVFPKTIKYHPLTIQDQEYKINTVGVRGLNWEKLQSNNDLDVTGVMIDVRVNEEGYLMLKFHISPHFWKFLSPEKEGQFVVKPIEGQVNSSAKTAVRAAYKAYQMNLDYDISSVDPTDGILAGSHFEKINEMKDWERNPFKNNQVRPVTYKIE